MYKNIHIEKIAHPSYVKKQVEVGMLRLDKIHPIVSGNKIFKLNDYLKKAETAGMTKMISFGGPYSNHLHASAFMAKMKGLKAIGMIRGFVPNKLSITLQDCKDMGMELEFIAQDHYDRIDLQRMAIDNPDTLIIPQGGYGRTGAEGAASIMALQGVDEYTIIMASCGTGTMGAGLVIGANPDQAILLISVLKNNFSIKEEINHLLMENEIQKTFSIEHRFHLGGYAKKNMQLFETMNRFYESHGIPTDFVYTGKLVFAFEQLLAEDRFPRGSKILLIHSGGLQGNRSLDNKALFFDAMS